MAKMNRFIFEYKDCIKRTGITPSNSNPSKVVIRRFVRLFKEVDDARIPAMIDYPLSEILVIAFLAILGDASQWVEIEDFGKAHLRWLKKFLKLRNGIPSHDTFRRVFALIDSEQLQAVTVAFLVENINSLKKSLGIQDTGYRHICVDGKEQKGTGRKYDTNEKIRNLQTLHIYDASNDICLFSQAIDKKTNEIPVAQELLKKMELKECIITFDSMHTQKETIRIIIERNGDYVGGLKGNQGTLLIEAETTFSAETKRKLKESSESYYKTSEKAHGKVEIRRYYLKKAVNNCNGVGEWKNLRNFVCYEKYTCNIITKEEKTEIRYYITSLKDIELCADAIRGHWEVETGFHWYLDASFKEDDNTTMDKTAFNNYSLMNKMALSLCKLVKPHMKNHSIVRIRKTFGWNMEDNLSILLNNFDEEQIKSALENK